MALIGAASGPVINRLRDLSDVKLATTVSNGQVLTWDSTAQRWTNGTGSGSSGGITNSGGTANTLAKWTDTNSLGNSLILDDGSGNFQFGSTGAVQILILPPNNPNGDGTDLTFESSDPGVDGRGGDITFTAKDGIGDGRGGNINFTAGQGSGMGVGGVMLFTVPGDDGTLTFEASGNNGAMQFSASDNGSTISFNTPVVRPSGGSTSLGTVTDPWAEIVGTHGSFLNGLAVTNTLVLDGDLEMTGNPTIRSVPYIWPTVQGGAGTRLENDGAGVLTWESGGASQANPINNFYSTNNFFQSGKGNTLIITQTLTVSGQYVYPLVAGSGIAFTTNNIGTGQTNLTIAASGGGGSASTWVPNTALTYSGGTNLTIDGSGGTNFYVLLTNNAFFATPSNVPANKATNTTFTIFFQQDSTGTRTVTWTNASFKWPGGPTAAFQPSTNANAVSYVSFTMSPFTNSIFMGDYGVLDVR